MSQVLNRLKSVKESIEHNYTSYQLLTILDKLLMRALKPIIENTDFFDRILANVIAWAATNPRRKLSALPRERLNTLVMAYLATDDPAIKFRIARKMKLERNIIFYSLDRFRELTLNLTPTIPGTSVLQQLCVTQPDKLWFAARTATYWFLEASRFKNMIMEKYMRLVMMQTQMYYKQQQRDNPHLTFDLDDIAQNFVLAVSKAIDKCDASQGTLTTYVENWIKDAKSTSHFRHEYGIAYSIPASRRRAIAENTDRQQTMNISVSMDAEELQELAADQDMERDLERRDTIRMVRILARAADPAGIARMFLGIGEQLTDTEIAAQKTVNSTVSA